MSPCLGGTCPGLKEDHDYEFCVNECTHQCIPASIILHIASKQRTDVHQGQYISVTSLTDSACPRQIYLERTMPYYAEHAKMWWSMRGSLLHALLQNPNLQGLLDDMRRYVKHLINEGGAINPEEAQKLYLEIEAKVLELDKLFPNQKIIQDWMAETTFQYSLGVINGKERILYGTADVIRPLKKELIDYKTCGDRGIGVIKQGAKSDHIQQFNIYRFIIMKGHPVGVDPKDYTPIEIETIKAYYMTMMQVVGTGGIMTETTEYRVSHPEPGSYQTVELLSTKEELITKKGKRKDSINPQDKELKIKSKFRLTHQIPDVPIMDLNEVEQFIRLKAQPLFDAFDSGDVPDMVGPEVRAWKCSEYCADAIRGECDRINLIKGTPREVPISETLIQVEI